ncbi:TPA: hypothetical protein QCI16_004983 [Enterobacter ludwigii]|nr:hypothetical protein [Enterobacter ludwigii]HDR2600736.1 hypothetical protein [Enterobacter ludwigii]
MLLAPPADTVLRLADDDGNPSIPGPAFGVRIPMISVSDSGDSDHSSRAGCFLL